jgi:hypothetical protein
MNPIDFEAHKIQELRDELDLSMSKARQYSSVHAKDRYFGDRNHEDHAVMREFYERNYRTLLNLSSQQALCFGLLQKLVEMEKQRATHVERDRGFKWGLFSGILVGIPLGGLLGRFP